jgi:hypothetical protein
MKFQEHRVANTSDSLKWSIMLLQQKKKIRNFWLHEIMLQANSILNGGYMFLLYCLPIRNICFVATVKCIAIVVTYSQCVKHFIKNVIHNFHTSHIYFYISVHLGKVQDNFCYLSSYLHWVLVELNPATCHAFSPLHIIANNWRTTIANRRFPLYFYMVFISINSLRTTRTSRNIYDTNFVFINDSILKVVCSFINRIFCLWSYCWIIPSLLNHYIFSGLIFSCHKLSDWILQCMC